MSESIHHYLERNRKPRVHIKYEIETGEGVQEKELPFVVGVMGDFAADNLNQIPLKERHFINIDRDNFDSVMARINPSLRLQVSNTLKEDKTELKLDLNFKSLSDFEPESLIQQIEPLRKLKLARDRLRDLLNKAECSEHLEEMLSHCLQDEAKLRQLALELGITQLNEKTGVEDV